MERNFSHDWFSNNIQNWIKILGDLKDQKNLNFLEIGSYEGRATCWLLDEILTDPSSKITCIDTFEGGYEHKNLNLDFSNTLDIFKSNISNKKDQVTILHGTSYQKLIELQNKNQYDFIYIDGSHESKNVLQDAILSFELLKKDGIMIFDDYLWGDFTNNPVMTPKLAIDVFLKIYQKDIRLIHTGYQVAVVRN